jgi:hypothetical protein
VLTVARARALQHLAFEDLCFAAEKGGYRRDAVFADDTGASWTALLTAALKPVDAAQAAAKVLGNAASTQKALIGAVRELRRDAHAAHANGFVGARCNALRVQVAAAARYVGHSRACGIGRRVTLVRALRGAEQGAQAAAGRRAGAPALAAHWCALPLRMRFMHTT